MWLGMPELEAIALPPVTFFGLQGLFPGATITAVVPLGEEFG